MFQAAFDWGVADLPLAQDAVARNHGLRWYQEEAKAAIEAGLRRGLHQLLVMATGLGKSRTLAAVISDWPGDVLVLAHRDELVQQLVTEIESTTGEQCEVEQAQLTSSPGARIVVGSVQSFNQKRLDRLGRQRFSLVVVDEGHHYTASTYKRALEWFQCPRLGVTATPDRGDGQALGKILDEVAYTFGIVEGIEQGYLVPIVGKQVELKSIDLSGVGKTAGELVAAQLDEAMLTSVGAIVTETVKLYPDRQGIVFMPGVKTAELACELFNKIEPGSAIFISGETDRDERKSLVKAFKQGQHKYLCNCQVATEGFDAPAASLVVMGRPTLSRALYAQMAGRGTRVLPGVVDQVQGADGAARRRQLIQESRKPDMVILDFVGNSGKHTLAGVVDILGGDFTEAEQKVAKKKLKEAGGDVRAALQAARAELKKIVQAAKVQVKSEVRSFNPFSVLHVAQEQPGQRQPMTPGQFDWLKRMGLDDSELKDIGKAGANKLITAAKARQQRGLATYKQLRALQKFGVTDINISISRASQTLDYIFGECRAKRRPDPATIQQMLHRKRDAGDE